MMYCCSCRLGPQSCWTKNLRIMACPRKGLSVLKVQWLGYVDVSKLVTQINQNFLYFSTLWVMHHSSGFSVWTCWASGACPLGRTGGGEACLGFGCSKSGCSSVGGIWYWEMVGVSLKMSKRNSHGTPFSLRFDLSSYQHTWTSPSGCGGTSRCAMQHRVPRSFTGWTKKEVPSKKLTSYPSKKWHIWVDDFPNFPFGGDMYPFPWRVSQDITDLARPHDIQAWVACVVSWAWLVWTTMVHKIHITIRRNRGEIV